MAVPDCGDLVWINFKPQAGHEQSGRRPALVMSPRAYNSKTNFVVVCPITSKVKGWPFEVELPEGLAVEGAVLSDQIKSLDRHARNIEPAGTVPGYVLEDVRAKVRALLF